MTIQDSWHRCIYCGKKMVLTVMTKADDESRNLHECWNCTYRIEE